MKRSVKVILILLLLAVAGGVGVLWRYMAGMSEVEAEAFLTELKEVAVEKVAPLSVALLSGVAVILGMLAPVVSRVRDAAGRFHEAVSSVQGTESRAGQAVEAMETWKEDMERVQAEAITALKAETEARLSAMEERIGVCADRMDTQNRTVEETAATAAAIRAMLLVAGTNTQELVASGKARKLRMLADGSLSPERVLDGTSGGEEVDEHGKQSKQGKG